MAANCYTDIHTRIDEAVLVSLDEAGDTLGSEGVEGFGFDSHPVYGIPGVWKEEFQKAEPKPASLPPAAVQFSHHSSSFSSCHELIYSSSPSLVKYCLFFFCPFPFV